MAEIRLKENESLESALRRFKKQCARAGVIAEVRKREAYEKYIQNNGNRSVFRTCISYFMLLPRKRPV